MKRRNFIKATGIAGLAGTIGLPSCTAALDAQYIILGGGISGLYLGHLLDKAGKDYILLEGSNRYGGRLFTHTELQNREVGGRGIGDKYVELMKIVNELQVELIDITDYMRSPTCIYKDGQLLNDWTNSDPNPRMLEYILPKEGPSLNALDEWYKRPDLDVTYSDLLLSRGRSETELDIINISANYNDIRETSAINSLHSGAFRKFNGSNRIYNFKNGSKSLVDTIVGSLKGQTFVDKMVKSIKDSKNGVSVTCEDGTAYKAAKVISTLPFSTLRDVTLSMDSSSNQKKAIEELNYTLITQIHLKPTEHFWEEDGYHVDMWTDTPLERIMNSSAHPDQYELVCWVNGKGTSYFDNMSDKQIADYTLNKLKEIRPATAGKLEYVGTHNWGQYRYNKGAYAEFGVGQAALFEDMIKPAGNVHFAGEHTAKASRGIEGAAESAVRVFKELNT